MVQWGMAPRKRSPEFSPASSSGPWALAWALIEGLIRLLGRLGWVYAMGWLFALGLLTLFAKLADDVLEGEFTKLNHAVLNFLHAHANPWLDQMALSLSALGGITGTFVIAGLLVFFLLMRRRALDAATLVIVLAGGGVLTWVLKQIFRLPRPSLFESLAPETSFSFPSGHSLVSVCLYGFLSILLLSTDPRRTWPAALALLLLPVGIMWSRLYLGVHWLSDVLAGALVAGFWLTVCLMLRRVALRRLR